MGGPLRTEARGAVVPGHTGSENVFWNNRGHGKIVSQQFGHGYLIGNQLKLETQLESTGGTGTAPIDYVEDVPIGSMLLPTSLYESQLARRSE